MSHIMGKRKRVLGVLCDQNLNLRVKVEVCKTVLRPEKMYDAETWALEKAQYLKLGVAEMKMLRWISLFTRLDRIMNESSINIQERVGN